MIYTRISHWSLLQTFANLWSVVSFPPGDPMFDFPTSSNLHHVTQWHSTDLGPHKSFQKSWNWLKILKQNMSFPFKTTLDVFSWLKNIRYQQENYFISDLQSWNIPTSQPISREPFSLPWKWCPGTHDLSHKLSSIWQWLTLETAVHLFRSCFTDKSKSFQCFRHLTPFDQPTTEMFGF